MGRRRAMRVGLGQIAVRMGRKEENVARALAAAEEAGRAGCDVLVLPECLLAGWLSPAARRAAEPVTGPYVRRLAAVARRRRMAIVSGFEEREGGDVYNSAVFLDRRGDVRARHRKVNELDVARGIYGPGRTLTAFGFEGRVVSMNICADSWSAPATDALYAMGARTIFSPCAWAVTPGAERSNLAWIRSCYRARARGRDLTVVACNGVGGVTQGKWRGRVLQGNSLVTGPGGKTLLQGPLHEETLLLFDV